MNLWDDPWIRVATADGVREVSGREAVVGAHEFTRLEGETPTQDVAILRQVLLPMIEMALGGIRSVEQLGEVFFAGRFDVAVIDAEIDRIRHRFNLFDPEVPFGQVADLEKGNGEVDLVALLIPYVVAGGGVPLFSPFTDNDSISVSPAGLARWVVHAQCYDVAGIKGGAVGDPEVKGGKIYGTPVGPCGEFEAVIPHGRNLFETLVLNLAVREAGPAPGDLPWWDRDHPGPQWSVRNPTGPLDWMTWPARRIRLFRDEDTDQVTGVIITAGDRCSVFPNEFERHAVWRAAPSKRKDGREFIQQRPQSARAVWRGFESLIAVATIEEAPQERMSSSLLEQVGDLQMAGVLPEDYPLVVELIGVEYGPQRSVFSNLTRDSLPLPVAALRTDRTLRALLDGIATEADALVTALNTFEGDLRRSLGSELVPWDSGERASARFIQDLDRVVRRILRGMQERPASYDDAVTAWRAVARTLINRAADELVQTMPPAAFKGRLESDESSRRHNVARADLGLQHRLGQILGTTAQATEGAESPIEHQEESV